MEGRCKDPSVARTFFADCIVVDNGVHISACILYLGTPYSVRRAAKPEVACTTTDNLGRVDAM